MQGKRGVKRNQSKNTGRVLAILVVVGLGMFIAHEPPDAMRTGGDQTTTQESARNTPSLNQERTPLTSSEIDRPSPAVIEADDGDLTEVAQTATTSAIATDQSGVDEAPVPGDENIVAEPQATLPDSRRAISANLAWPATFFDDYRDAKKGDEITIALPGAQEAVGIVSISESDDTGLISLTGTLVQPEAGTFFVSKQSRPGVAGSVIGVIRYEENALAYRIEPDEHTGAPYLVAHDIDAVMCVEYGYPVMDMQPDGDDADTSNENAADPNTSASATSAAGVPILESLPGAAGVLYIDVDGETGPFSAWGEFDADPAGYNDSTIEQIWERVSVDFRPFNLNVTTSLDVYLAAPVESRQRCIVSNSMPGSGGGVAYLGSFNWTDDVVCWARNYGVSAAAEVISHEFGHTVRLAHDGRIDPPETYYGGHGSGQTGWAPIMGVGYSKSLVQWSKGEYASANNTQDDLDIIAFNNNSVGYREDDHGDTPVDSSPLNFISADQVQDSGIIETTGDIDAFQFTIGGGDVTITVRPAHTDPNLDIDARITDLDGNQFASSNPPDRLDAEFDVSLGPGTYTVQVAGTGVGSPPNNGYTNYASLGEYAITGSIIDVDRAIWAVDDSFSTDEDQAVLVDVLDNDITTDNTDLVLQQVFAAMNGDVQVVDDNGISKVLYSPNSNFNGTDSFEYQIHNATESDIGRATIMIRPANDHPSAVADHAICAVGRSVVIDVLANDSDIDQDTLALTSVTQPALGTTEIVGNTVRYTTNLDIPGLDSFTYTIGDGNGGSSTAAVSVEIIEGFAGIPMSYGRVEDVSNTAWKTVVLDTTFESMIVVPTIINTGDNAPLAPRIRNATGNTFEITVARVDNSNDAAIPVSVYYLAIEAGVYTDGDHGVKMEALTFESSRVDENSSWVGDRRTYSNTYANPVVVGQVITANDPRLSIFWSHGATVVDPPSTSDLWIGKHVGEDPNTNRQVETIGYIVVEQGAGFIGEIPFTAAIGADTVEGVDNNPPFMYPVAGIDTVDVAVGCIAGMDGGDGAWAILYEDLMPTTLSIAFAADEDQLNDSERRHTTEQIAYFALQAMDTANNAPVARFDSGETPEDTPLAIDALSNDSDIDGDPLDFVNVSDANNGRVSITGGATGPVIQYIPNENFNGTDGFHYTIHDGQGGMASADVAVTVTPVNDNPTAVDDDVSTPADTAVVVDVLENDRDIDGDDLELDRVSSAAGGSVSIESATTLLYAPNAGFVGVDAFTYTIRDTNGGFATATVRVHVEPVVDGPTMSHGIVHDIPGSTWTTVNLDTPYDSMVVVVTPQYQQNQPPMTTRVRQTGIDSFQLRIARLDGRAEPISGVSAHYLVVEAGVYTVANHGVKLEAARFESTVTDRSGSWQGERVIPANSYDSPVVLGQVLSANDSSASMFWSRGETRSAPPSTSQIWIGKHVGEDADRTRSDETIGYVIIETGSGTIGGNRYSAAVGANIVRGIDDAPPYFYPIDGIDNPGATIASQAAMNGGNGGWAVLYDAASAPASAGRLSLAIDEDQWRDSERRHTTEQVAFIAFESDTDPNTDPIANSDEGETLEDISVVIDVLANDSDPNGDLLEIATFTQGAFGDVAVADETGVDSLIYTPHADYHGADSFTYTIRDGAGGHAIGTVVIAVAPVNDPPIAVDDQARTFAGDTISIDILSNDTDVDGDDLEIIAVSQPGHGFVNVEADATLSYTADEDFIGADELAYTISDGNGGTAVATITVQIDPVSAGPNLLFGVVDDMSNSEWSTVTLDHIYESMVVVLTPVYDDSTVPVVPRVRNALGNRFEIRLDRADGGTTEITGIPVHYLVVEEGIYTESEHGVTLEAVTYVSGVTDSSGSWVGENQRYANAYTRPVALGQVMSYNDPRPSMFWSRGNARSVAPTADALWVGKHVGEDTNRTRNDERIGYIVIESGTGIIDGFRYDAAVGEDRIRGVGDRPPYHYATDIEAPLSAIVCQTGMDGANGGWAILYGDDPLAPGELAAAIDEDQFRDPERRHTTEQVAYIVFETIDQNAPHDDESAAGVKDYRGAGDEIDFGADDASRYPSETEYEDGILAAGARYVLDQSADTYVFESILEPGPNLVSIPVATSTTFDDIFRDIEVTGIHRWDNHGQTLVPVDFDASPVPGTGYWVQNDGDFSEYTVDGAAGFQSVPLVYGWNLIGGPTYRFVLPLDTGLHTALSWNPETAAYDERTTLIPGRGYLIFAPAATMIDY